MAYENAKLFEHIFESEGNFRSLFDTTSDVIFIIHPSGVIKSLNPAFDQALGWRGNNWIGRHFSELVHPKDLQVVGEDIRRAVNGETVSGHSYRILGENGYLPFGVSMAPRLREGRVLELMGIGRDMSQKHRSEQRAAVQLSMSRLLVNEELPSDDIVAKVLAESLEWTMSLIWRPSTTGNAPLECTGRWQSAENGSNVVHLNNGQMSDKAADVVRALPERVLESGKMEWIQDLSLDLSTARLVHATENKLRSGVCFPIGRDGNAVAIAGLFHRDAMVFDDDLVALFEVIGSQIGIAVLRNRATEYLRTSLQEKERLLEELQKTQKRA